MDDRTRIDVGYVANLARLELNESDRERLQRDMESIVAYIAELSEVDIDGVEPTAHAVPLTNVWREDVPGTPPGREVMLANAPAVLAGELVKVPQVLPGEGIN